MPDSKMEREDPVFVFVEQLLRAAIKKNIELETQWEVTKVHFENEWEAQRLHPSVEETYCLQTSDADVDVDFADDDDIESLTNCYVTFDAVGELAAALRAHGVRPQIEVDIFNSAVGSGVALLSDEDVDNEVSLLHIWIEKPAMLNGFLEMKDCGARLEIPILLLVMELYTQGAYLD